MFQASPGWLEYCIMLLVDAGSGGDDHDHGVNNPVRATGFGPQLSHHFPPKHAQLQMVKMERRGV